ncbi:nitrate reductase molybdenum cofactor assembly chaperone [Rouxiella sp. Mn2063]|uniref:nitrate reductase molybdenum cofactor assembly chaperone n=1 Tax=Rouxiella sp. Mn2063 TaxID=3395262 RepID=UPI003BE3F378
MKSLKMLGCLLDYPNDALWLHRQELLDESAEHSPEIQSFITELCQQEMLDAQAAWGELFERGRATSLLLFEHVHGESRDRGQAMVDLLSQYQQVGLFLDKRELPDYLPVYLEYLSILSDADARQGLEDIAPILALLGARLKQRESRYAVLIDTLLVLAESPLCSDAFAPRVAVEEDDTSPQALDAVWQEEQVRFIADKSCSSSNEYQQRFANTTLPQYVDLMKSQPDSALGGR